MKLSSPFFHHAMATPKVMLLVCAALIPGILVQSYFFGVGVFINLALCSVFAVGTEFCILKIRNKAPLLGIRDNSALLTALLLGVALPPLLPFWMVFVGASFAIIFAKQLYGGLGHNPFNPAMVGYVLLLISFPVEMTAWIPSKELGVSHPDIKESFALVFFSQTSTGLTVEHFRTLADGFTMATPLDHFKTEYTLGRMTSEIQSQAGFSDNLIGWTWVNIAYLIGGLFLIFTKTIRPQIPIALLAGIFLSSALLYAFDSEQNVAPWMHMFTGASMLGAFFIATDPVSASTTPKGRIYYGFSIGILIVIIRAFGGYPDGIAFAVLLLNLAVPTIDHYTKPVVYGHKQDGDNDR